MKVARTAGNSRYVVSVTEIGVVAQGMTRVT
jgi:hypothetical protein